MEDKYSQTLSDDLLKSSSSHAINFLIFPENSMILPDITFKDSFIIEGFFLGLCIKVTAHIKINFTEYYLEPDCLIVLFPKQVIHILEKSDDFLIESLYISLDYLIGLPFPKDFPSIFNMQKYPCFKISRGMMQNLQEYYSFIVKQYNKDSFYHDSIIKGLLYSMIMEFLCIYRQNKTDEKLSKSSRKEELVNDFFKLLVTNLKKERSVTFYADKLHVTRKHLSSTVKEVTGQSVLEWIHEVFIVQAKVILKNTNKSIIEISEELNISNPSFFCRLFKKYTGMSPLEYRASK